MPELLVDVDLPWGQGASVYASAFQFPWKEGASVYGPTGTYTPGTPPGGTVPTSPVPLQPGSVIPARTVYAQAHTFSLTDERDDSALDATSITISTDEDSIFWTLNAQGGASLYAALTAGEQPAAVLAEINGLQWRFVIDQVSRSREFGAAATAVTGRSPSVLAGLPYERVQNFSIEGETTANQIMVTANAFTGLEIDWQLLDWNVPARVFNLTGTPLDVVRNVAASVGAIVQSDRTETKVRILPRFPVLPGEWSCVVPDVEIAFEAMITESYERIDQADYDGVYLSGQQQGLLGFVRLQGTNGGKQHPVVTDVLLTAEPALLQRGAAILGASGSGARTTASLPVLTGEGEAGVLTVGQLCRVQDPDEVWWGLVQSVSVTASVGSLRQTVGFKRATVDAVEATVAPFAFSGPIAGQSATVGVPFSLALGPFWTGGEGARTYSLRRGPLPPGITFNQTLGTLAGTPTAAGTYTPIAIRATDEVSNQADSNDFTFTVSVPAPALTYLIKFPFNGTQNQSTGIQNTGTLGGTYSWANATFGYLDTAAPKHGSACAAIYSQFSSSLLYDVTSVDLFVATGESLVMGVWVKRGANYSSSSAIILNYTSTTLNAEIALLNSNAVRGQVFGGGIPLVNGSAPLANNVWAYVEINVSATTAYIFVDGVLVGTGAVQATRGGTTGRVRVFQTNGQFLVTSYADDAFVAVGDGAVLHTTNFTPPGPL